jgi:hypothetical protein
VEAGEEEREVGEAGEGYLGGGVEWLELWLLREDCEGGGWGEANKIRICFIVAAAFSRGKGDFEGDMAAPYLLLD